MNAVIEIYKSYWNPSSEGLTSIFWRVDSALLLNHKNGLDEPAQGYYKNRGKFSEMKMAAEISEEPNVKLIL